MHCCDLNPFKFRPLEGPKGNDSIVRLVDFNQKTSLFSEMLHTASIIDGCEKCNGTIVQFQKISIPPTEGQWKFQGGGGVIDGNFREVGGGGVFL